MAQKHSLKNLKTAGTGKVRTPDLWFQIELYESCATGSFWSQHLKCSQGLNPRPLVSKANYICHAPVSQICFESKRILMSLTKEYQQLRKQSSNLTFHLATQTHNHSAIGSAWLLNGWNFVLR